MTPDGYCTPMGAERYSKVEYCIVAGDLFNNTVWLPRYAPHDLFSVDVEGFPIPVWGIGAGALLAAAAVAAVLVLWRRRLRSLWQRRAKAKE